MCLNICVNISQAWYFFQCLFSGPTLILCPSISPNGACKLATFVAKSFMEAKTFIATRHGCKMVIKHQSPETRILPGERKGHPSGLEVWNFLMCVSQKLHLLESFRVEFTHASVKVKAKVTSISESSVVFLLIGVSLSCPLFTSGLWISITIS